MTRGAILLLCLAVTPAAAQGGFELRAGALTMLSRRAAMFEGSVGTGSGMMPGGELLVRLRYVGVTGRLFGGGIAADSGGEAEGKLSGGDVRVVAGPRFLAADLGYGRRGFSGAFGGRSWPFARLGLRSGLAIGASGLSAEVLLAYYAGLGSDGGASGREAETRLVYTPDGAPLYLAFGYRHERFTVTATTDVRPEEVGAVIFAAGFRWAR